EVCTAGPASVASAGLGMIPGRAILPLGRAIVGVIDVIAIHGRARAASLLTPAAAAGPAGAAAAGTAVSHPAPAAKARAPPASLQAAWADGARPAAAGRGLPPPRCSPPHAMP